MACSSFNQVQWEIEMNPVAMNRSMGIEHETAAKSAYKQNRPILFAATFTSNTEISTSNQNLLFQLFFSEGKFQGVDASSWLVCSHI